MVVGCAVILRWGVYMMTGDGMRNRNFLDQSDNAYVCLECRATWNGKGNGRCKSCAGRLVRQDQLTDEDLQELWEGSDDRK